MRKEQLSHCPIHTMNRPLTDNQIDLAPASHITPPTTPKLEIFQHSNKSLITDLANSKNQYCFMSKRLRNKSREVK